MQDKTLYQYFLGLQSPRCTYGDRPCACTLFLLAILPLGHRAELDRKIEKFLRPNPTLIFTFVHNQKRRSLGMTRLSLRMDTADRFTVFVCKSGGLLPCHVKPEVV